MRYVSGLELDTGTRPTVVLPREQHQAFTNAWRQRFPYTDAPSKVSAEDVLAAASEIYVNYPELLKAIGLS
jgi:hypothetical protein